MPSPINRMMLRAMVRSSIAANLGPDTIAFQVGCEPERETGLAVATAGPAWSRKFFHSQYRPKWSCCRVSTCRRWNVSRWRFGLEFLASRVIPYAFPPQGIRYDLGMRARLTDGWKAQPRRISMGASRGVSRPR